MGALSSSNTEWGRGGAKSFHPLKRGGGCERFYPVLRGGGGGFGTAIFTFSSPPSP